MADAFDNILDMRIPMVAGPKLDVRRPGVKRRSKEGFVMFPLNWRERLGRVDHVSAMWLALFITYQSWRNPGKPVTVSNVAMEGWGHISREEKRQGLRELEACGLVSIEQVGRQAPKATIL
jgi:hypothetical protein